MDAELTLFGGFRLTREGANAEIKAQKSKALLAWLALHPGENQTRERLAELLWEDRSPANARASLRQALAVLRRVLPDGALSAGGESIGLIENAVRVDVTDFRRLKTDPTGTALRRAADLYAGELLDGFRPKAPAFEEWLLMEREMLRQEALAVMSKLLEHELQANERAAAIKTAVQMLSLDPLQEIVHRHLMRLYVEQGQLGTALRQFRLCRDVLERELATPPSVETINLYRAIRAGDVTGNTPSPVSEPATPDAEIDAGAELHDVTVLYTGLAEPAGDAQAALQTRLEEVIKGQLGDDHAPVVPQSADDLIVVLGLEDSPSREVDAALDLATQLHLAWAKEPAAARNAQLQVGVATGQAMVTEDGQISGIAVSEAAALCVHAKPGQTVISTAVMRTMSDSYRCERIDDARVVNAGQPWRLLDADEQPTDRRAVLPSIAVLPFMSMSADPEHGYLADGMTEELINLLAHSVNWRVSSRNLSFRYKDTHVDVREIGRDLDVGYVVEGSIRRIGDRIRVTAQLVNTADGTHIWSDKYDRPLDEIFDVQDEVVHSIFRVLRNRIGSAERERIRRTHKANLDAWGLLMKAMQIYVVDEATQDEQRALVREALAVDPNYPRARAYLASILCISVGRGQSSNRKADMSEGMEHAEIALASGESDQVVLRMCAGGFAAIGESQRALALAERAYELSGVPDPLLVAVLMWNGRLEEAMSHCSQIVASLAPGMVGSPGELRPVALLGNLHMLAGDFDAALDYAEQDLRAFPGNYFCHVNAANLYGFLGRFEDASEAWDQAKTLMPQLSVRGFSIGYNRVFTDADLAKQFSAGLRRAGLE